MLRDVIKPAGITLMSERVRFSYVSPDYLEDGAIGKIMGVVNYSSPPDKDSLAEGSASIPQSVTARSPGSNHKGVVQVRNTPRREANLVLHEKSHLK